jgi:type III secretion protein Q
MKFLGKNADPLPGTPSLPPLRLRALDAASVRLANAIGAGRTARIEIDGISIQVELSTEADIQPGIGATRWFDTRHGPISVIPGDALIHLLTGIDLPDAARPVDSELSLWIAATAIANLPSDWQALFAMRGTLAAASSPDMVSLTLRLLPDLAGWSFAGRLCCSLDTLCALLAMPGWHATSAAATADTDHLLIRKPVVIGAAAIRPSELLALGNGDLLLIDVPAFRFDGKGRIAFGPRLWMDAELTNTDTNLQLQFNAWSTAMDELVSSTPDNEDEPARQSAAAILDDLTVTLSFEVGTVERSIGELKQLAAGNVIRLASALPPSVVVRCRQAEIARGELVDVEGRMAVQITAVGRRHDGL